MINGRKYYVRPLVLSPVFTRLYAFLTACLAALTLLGGCGGGQDPIIGTWDNDPDSIIEEFERGAAEDGRELTQEDREWIEGIVYGEEVRFEMNIAEDGTVTVSGQSMGEEVNTSGTWERIRESHYRLTTEPFGEANISIAGNVLIFHEIFEVRYLFRRKQLTLPPHPGVQSPVRAGGEQADGEDDAEARAFYENNPSQFAHPDQRRARHILFRVEPHAPASERDEARRRAQHARDRIARGEDVATLAKTLSEDPGSALRGGDLGFFDRESMVEPFASAAFETEVGELAPIVETEFGFHVLQVTEAREAGVVDFTERVEAERAAGALAQQWARRYRDATPISAAEFLQRVPAVSVRVRASPFITQHLPIETILDLIVQQVEGAGIRVDPHAPVVLDVSLLWHAAEWTTRRGGQVLSSSPIHSKNFRMQLLVAAPVYRDGGFHRAQFAAVTRWTAGSAWGDWGRAALRNDITKTINDMITEIRRDHDRHASREAWTGLLWAPADDAAIHAAYQASREEDTGRLAPAMTGMSDIQPATFTFHGDGRRILRSTGQLEQQWRSRLERLGLRANPRSRNRITHDISAMQDPVSPVGGRLWGQLSEQFYALSSTARLWEDNVAFELNGDYVLMNVAHSWHAQVQVSMQARDLGQLAHAVQDAFLTEKFQEQMEGSRSRR